MLHYSVLFAVFFCTIYGKPLSDCNSQMTCMDLDVTELPDLDANGNQQHMLCLFFNDELPECSKQGSISHACPSEEKDDKIEKWKAGRNNAMCKIVSCGKYTYFGIKDGKTCDGGQAFGKFGITGYDEWVTCFDGGYCGGGNTKACKWLVSAPQCKETTTTDTPYTTTSDDATTSTSTPNDDTTATPNDDTTTSTVECVCSDITFGSDFADFAATKQECESCPGCLFHAEAGCMSSAPQDGDNSADNVYIRDGKTDMNTNSNFMLQEYEPNTTETNDGNKLIRGCIVAITTSIIVYLF